MIEHRSTKWIEVDALKYDPELRTKSHSGEFRVFISPYDLPDAVRADYTPSEHKVTVDFRYIGPEPVESRIVDESVRCFVGKISHRVFKIEADIDRLPMQSVAIRLLSAIDHLEAQLGPGETPEENFRVAKEVISDNRNRLLVGLESPPMI